MFRIAICDDDKVLCAQLEDIILAIGEKNNVKFEVDSYLTGESLCQKLDDGEKYDALFLDIELLTMTGIEIGHIIRDEKDDNETQIIYISGKTDYALELFNTRPLDFLIKPLIAKEVDKTLLTALKLLRLKTRYLAFSTNRQTIRVPFSKILYFESDGKKVKIFTDETQYEIYGALKQIKEQLSSRDFLEIHKSFIVNYNYVKEYTSIKVMMTDGKSLPISRSRKKDVQKWLIARKEDDIIV